MVNFPMRWWCLAVACLCGIAGCRGSGRLELASLDYGAIDPPAPRFVRLDLQECYWWTDEDGQVWVAMQREQSPLLNPKMRFQFQLSLALEKLPAGRARNYRVAREELRARVHFGPWESRFSSRAGIVALYRESGDRLRGNLRLQAARVSTRLLGGWGRPTRYLILGSFTAVHDEQRGRSIAEVTESAGWDRGAPARRRGYRPAPTPATAPATAPTKP